MYILKTKQKTCNCAVCRSTTGCVYTCEISKRSKTQVKDELWKHRQGGGIEPETRLEAKTLAKITCEMPLIAYKQPTVTNIYVVATNICATHHKLTAPPHRQYTYTHRRYTYTHCKYTYTHCQYTYTHRQYTYTHRRCTYTHCHAKFMHSKKRFIPPDWVKPTKLQAHYVANVTENIFVKWCLLS